MTGSRGLVLDAAVMVVLAVLAVLGSPTREKGMLSERRRSQRRRVCSARMLLLASAVGGAPSSQTSAALAPRKPVSDELTSLESEFGQLLPAAHPQRPPRAVAVSQPVGMEDEDKEDSAADDAPQQRKSASTDAAPKAKPPHARTAADRQLGAVAHRPHPAKPTKPHDSPSLAPQLEQNKPAARPARQPSHQPSHQPQKRPKEQPREKLQQPPQLRQAPAASATMERSAADRQLDALGASAQAPRWLSYVAAEDSPAPAVKAPPARSWPAKQKEQRPSQRLQRQSRPGHDRPTERYDDMWEKGGAAALSEDMEAEAEEDGGLGHREAVDGEGADGLEELQRQELRMAAAEFGVVRAAPAPGGDAAAASRSKRQSGGGGTAPTAQPPPREYDGAASSTPTKQQRQQQQQHGTKQPAKQPKGAAAKAKAAGGVVDAVAPQEAAKARAPAPPKARGDTEERAKPARNDGRKGGGKDGTGGPGGRAERRGDGGSADGSRSGVPNSLEAAPSRATPATSAAAGAAAAAAAAITASSAAAITSQTVHECRCNGNSNPHGFGAYCRAWETPTQAPWCYVPAECPAGTAVGDYGKFDECKQPPSPFSPGGGRLPAMGLWGGLSALGGGGGGGGHSAPASSASAAASAAAAAAGAATGGRGKETAGLVAILQRALATQKEKAAEMRSMHDMMQAAAAATAEARMHADDLARVSAAAAWAPYGGAGVGGGGGGGGWGAAAATPAAWSGAWGTPHTPRWGSGSHAMPWWGSTAAGPPSVEEHDFEAQGHGHGAAAAGELAGHAHPRMHSDADADADAAGGGGEDAHSLALERLQSWEEHSTGLKASLERQASLLETLKRHLSAQAAGGEAAQQLRMAEAESRRLHGGLRETLGKLSGLGHTRSSGGGAGGSNGGGGAAAAGGPRAVAPPGSAPALKAAAAVRALREKQAQMLDGEVRHLERVQALQRQVGALMEGRDGVA